MFVQCCITTPLGASSAVVPSNIVTPLPCWNVVSFWWWAVNALYSFLWLLLLSDEQWNFVGNLGRPVLSGAPAVLPVCGWLVGRVSRSGQLNDYCLVCWWSCRLHSLVFWLWSKLLSGTMERTLCWAERQGRDAVWKGPFLDMCGVPPHYILIQLLFLLCVVW